MSAPKKNTPPKAPAASSVVGRAPGGGGGGGDGKDTEVRQFVQSLRGEMANFAQNYPKPGASTPPKMPAAVMTAASAVGSTTPAGSLPTSPTSTLVETLSHTLTAHTGAAYTALPPPANQSHAQSSPATNGGGGSGSSSGAAPIVPSSTVVTATPVLTGISGIGMGASPTLTAGAVNVVLSPSSAGAAPDQSPPATPLSPPDSVPSATTPRRALSNPDLVEPDSAPARSQPNSPLLTKAGSLPAGAHAMPHASSHAHGGGGASSATSSLAVNEPATPIRDRERERDEQNVNALLQSPKTPNSARSPSSRANPLANQKANNNKHHALLHDIEPDSPLLRVDEHISGVGASAQSASAVSNGGSGSGSAGAATASVLNLQQPQQQQNTHAGASSGAGANSNGNGTRHSRNNSGRMLHTGGSPPPQITVNNPTNCRSIYLGGLPPDTVLSDLCDLIIQSGVRGAIEALKVMSDRALGHITFVEAGPATHLMEHAVMTAAVNPIPHSGSGHSGGDRSPSFGAMPSPAGTSGAGGNSASGSAAGSSGAASSANAQQPALGTQVMSGLVVRGRRVRIGWGSPGAMDAHTASAIAQGATRTVFLGGLDTSASEVVLSQQFTQLYGTIEKLDVLHHKRIAFVHFASITSAVACVAALQQQQIVALASHEHKSHSHHHRKSILRANFGPDRCAGPVPPKSFHNPPPSQAILSAVATGGVAAAAAVSAAGAAYSPALRSSASPQFTIPNQHGGGGGHHHNQHHHNQHQQHYQPQVNGSSPSPINSPTFQGQPSPSLPSSSPPNQHNTQASLPLLPPSSGRSAASSAQQQPSQSSFAGKKQLLGRSAAGPPSRSTGTGTGFRQYNSQQQQQQYAPQQQQSQYGGGGGGYVQYNQPLLQMGQQQQQQQQAGQAQVQGAGAGAATRTPNYRPAPALAHPRENQHHPYHPQFQQQRAHQQQHQQQQQQQLQQQQQQQLLQQQQQQQLAQQQAQQQQLQQQQQRQQQQQAATPSPQQSPQQHHHTLQYIPQPTSASPINAGGVSGGSDGGSGGGGAVFDQQQFEQDQRDEQEELLREQQEAAAQAAGGTSPQMSNRVRSTPQQRAQRQYRLYQANQLVAQQQQLYLQQQMYMQAQMQQQLFLQQQQAAYQHQQQQLYQQQQAQQQQPQSQQTNTQAQPLASPQHHPQQPLSPLSPDAAAAAAGTAYLYSPYGVAPQPMMVPLPLSVQMPAAALQQQQHAAAAAGYPIYMPVTAHPSPPQQVHTLSGLPPPLGRPGSHPLPNQSAAGSASGASGAGVPTAGFPFDPSAPRTIYVGGVAATTTLRALCDAIRVSMDHSVPAKSKQFIAAPTGSTSGARQLTGIIDRVHVVPGRQCAFITFVSPVDAESFYQFTTSAASTFAVDGKSVKVGWGSSGQIQPLTMDVWDAVIRSGASRTLYIGQISFLPGAGTGTDATEAASDEKDGAASTVELEVIDSVTGDTEALIAAVPPLSDKAKAAAAAAAKAAADSKSAGAYPSSFTARALHRKLNTDLTVFGPIERVSIVPSRQCAIVAFSSLQSAMRALQSLTRVDGSAPTSPTGTSSSPSTEIYAKLWRVAYTKDRCAMPPTATALAAATNSKSGK